MPFNRLDHHVLGSIRPRFTLRIGCEAIEAIDHIEQKFGTDKAVNGMRANQLIFLKTPSYLQHYWSPEMSVRIERSEITGSVFVNCLLGPRQAVWGMFALIYAAIILLTLFGSMYGFVKYQTTGETATLWILPVGILLFSTVFFSAKLGQRKGRDQMLHLVSFLYHSLAEITDVERVERD
jgi:hypothetical protein